MGLENVVILHNSESSYSKTLSMTFTNNFPGEVLQLVDLSTATKELEDAVDKLPTQTEAIVLFPSSSTSSIAIDFLRKVSGTEKNYDFHLLGSDVLYSNLTLTKGNEVTEGLILAVSWSGFTSKAYTERNILRWESQVSWQTANSYDATQALIETLSKQATREQILLNLKEVQLLASETSGTPFRFDENGEIVRKLGLVRQVLDETNSVEKSVYKFEPIE